MPISKDEETEAQRLDTRPIIAGLESGTPAWIVFHCLLLLVSTNVTSFSFFLEFLGLLHQALRSVIFVDVELSRICQNVGFGAIQRVLILESMH